MDKAMHKAKEQAIEYIEKLTHEGDMSGGKAEALFYATGVVKNVCKLEKMEDGASYDRSYDRSYDGFDEGNSGVRRNRMGQFSRNGSRSYDNGEMMETLGKLMRNADGEQRRALEECMRRLDN